ncbi:MAG TPA: ribonuclease R [Bacillota bacterium]|nr:ribonuclease R [Bacillota bacterium]HUM55976.1 ribonuclease R [Bacillota bacterium]
MKKRKNMKRVTGTLQKHKRGFGFVITETASGIKEEKDIFISGKDMNGAMNGDLVEVELIPARLWKNSPEGIVAGILSRSVSEVVGTFEKNGRFGFVIPDDRRLNEDIFVKKKDFYCAERGDKVVAEIIKYPSRTDSAQGRIKQIISRSGQPGGDIRSLIRQYGITEEFPSKAASEAKKLFAKGITEEDKEERRDLKDKMIFTIDGADSKDFDDAVSIDMLENGNYLLGVHIADVSSYVKEGSALDKEALKRGTSIYVIDQVVPMLPAELSNGICSLNPLEDRLCISVDMEIDKAGEVIRHEIYESIINSKARMVYTDVSDMLEKNSRELIKKYDSGPSGVYDSIVKMHELAKILEQRRDMRGSLDFDLEEAHITLNKEGIPVEVSTCERRSGNKLIEEFMLKANEVIAEHFALLKIPFVYRIHEKPSPDNITELMLFLKGFGIYPEGGTKDIKPKTLSRILKSISGGANENIISTVMLRSMQKAEYNTQCLGHFGLALKYYCHFTSPIRRYPDLMIHRIIKSWLKGELMSSAERTAGPDAKVAAKKTRAYKRLTKEAAEISSAKERQAIELEREAEKMKKAEYMSYHVGEEKSGIISGVTNYGIYVQLENTVEGMIKLSQLFDDYYEYDPAGHRVCGRRKGKTYSLGDTIDIRVRSVSIEDREINFDMI